MSALSAPDFAFVSSLVHSQAAIVLEPGKEYLVESRLGPLAEREGFSSLQSFIAAMRQDEGTIVLQAKAVDALTTNETSFFRDFHPFEALRQSLLPRLVELRGPARSLAIWSAACSTGQEPYSIAMIIREHFPELASWRIDIIATDLSARVLERARTGIFSQLEVNRGLPARYLVKYFENQDSSWHIKPDIRRMVEFRPFNLIGPWNVLPQFDLIFLRNVMIYFDVETKRSILKKAREFLQPHGSLLLGTAETTINIDPDWTPQQHGGAMIYCPSCATMAG